MNDYQFKIAKIKGEFIWHNHEDTDEAFIVVEGSMKIAFKDRMLETLRPIPKIKKGKNVK